MKKGSLLLSERYSLSRDFERRTPPTEWISSAALRRRLACGTIGVTAPAASSFPLFPSQKGRLPSRLSIPKTDAERPNMKNTTPPFVSAGSRRSAPKQASENAIRASVPLSRLETLVSAWLMAGEIGGHSERTTRSREERFRNVFWYLDHRCKSQEVGKAEINGFLAYLRKGHTEKCGRFGVSSLTEPLSQGTVRTYYCTLRTFFNWCVAEGECDISPLAGIPIPIDRADQVQPFSEQEIAALERAATATHRGKGEKQPNRRVRQGIDVRDAAIFYLLYDSGIRASELCSLKVGDVNLLGYEVLIRKGKGGKSRPVPISDRTRRALFEIIGKGLRQRSPDEYLFISQRGSGAGGPLTRGGLLALVNRWCEAAGIQAGRKGPHRFRHSFAIQYLRNGGDAFSLMNILGHTSLAMTNQYVALAKSDVSRQHARYSPVESLRKGRNR